MAPAGDGERFKPYDAEALRFHRTYVTTTTLGEAVRALRRIRRRLPTRRWHPATRSAL